MNATAADHIGRLGSGPRRRRSVFARPDVGGGAIGVRASRALLSLAKRLDPQAGSE
jgi:hypothetical protein